MARAEADRTIDHTAISRRYFASSVKLCDRREEPSRFWADYSTAKTGRSRGAIQALAPGHQPESLVLPGCQLFKHSSRNSYHRAGHRADQIDGLRSRALAD